jgi:hypothetical protein
LATAIGATWIIGCALTVAAVGFGARFWFDALQRFVNVRRTGPTLEMNVRRGYLRTGEACHAHVF